MFKKQMSVTQQIPTSACCEQVRRCCANLPTPYLRGTAMHRTPHLLLPWFPRVALPASHCVFADHSGSRLHSVVWGLKICILLSGSNKRERCEAKRIVQFSMIYISKLLNCRN